MQLSLQRKTRDGAKLAAIAAATVAMTWLLMQLEGGGPPPGAPPYRSPEWAVALHLGTVLPAVPLGALILWGRKGGARHKLLGRVWVGMMATTAVASFWVRGSGGGLSGIHLFSVATLIALPIALWRARVRDIQGHRTALVSLYIGLLVAGAFALAPDRVLGHRLFGSSMLASGQAPLIEAVSGPASADN